MKSIKWSKLGYICTFGYYDEIKYNKSSYISGKNLLLRIDKIQSSAGSVVLTDRAVVLTDNGSRLIKKHCFIIINIIGCYLAFLFRPFNKAPIASVINDVKYDKLNILDKLNKQPQPFEEIYVARWSIFEYDCNAYIFRPSYSQYTI